MRKALELFLFSMLVCLGGPAWAQGHDANWIFGDGFHIKFDDSGPTILPYIDDYFASEGASCISDRNGDLLFYSNTQRVWNRNFQLLLNGDSINSRDQPFGSSKTNGSLFLPYPGDTLGRYFALFVINEDNHELYYNKIDKELDGGLGGIVIGEKNLAVTNFSIGEQLTAVKHANGRDWWVIGKKGYPNSNTFFLILFHPMGIENPLLMPIDVVSQYYGELVVSSSGTHLAFVGSSEDNIPILSLYEFDRCTGNISFLDSTSADLNSDEYYGLEFANEANILYSSTWKNHTLFQFDFSTGRLVDSTIFRVRGPGFTTFDNRCGQLAIGPDKKIYMVMMRIGDSPGNSVPLFDKYIGAIKFPERIGSLCEFDTFAVFLNGRENRTFSLPNFPNYDLGPLVGSPCDTLSPVDTTQTSIPVFPQETTTWSVIPTISDGLFAIQGAANGTLVVYDLYGREVFREFLTNARSFDLSAHPAGLYWVTVQSDDGIWYPARMIVRQ